MAVEQFIKRYPPVGFHFWVQILNAKGLNPQDGFFSEVSGLSRELSTETVNSGGENRFSFKIPTRGQYPNLVLKRGLLVSSGLAGWVTDAIEHLDIQPATLVVTLLNEDHVPLQVYSVFNAYPVKWSVSDFNAGESQIVVESIELAYQYFNVMQVSSVIGFALDKAKDALSKLTKGSDVLSF